MTLFVQVSDTHFDGTEAAARRNRAVLAYLESIREMPVAAVLVTGDITDHGTAEEYEEAAATFVTPWPTYFLPGNHDTRPPFRSVLLGQAASDGPINTVVDLPEVRIVLCDTHIPPVDGQRVDPGHLDAATLAWLDDALADRSPEQRAIVALHHPPVGIHIPLMDPIALDNPEDLAVVLSRHDGIVGILTGHAHTACATSFEGVPVRIAPGVRTTVPLSEEPGAPITDALPPGLAFHVLDEVGLTTHFRYLSEP